LGSVSFASTLIVAGPKVPVLLVSGLATGGLVATGFERVSR
jgi:hypothetical protein